MFESNNECSTNYKEQGEVEFVLEDILNVPGFKCREPK